MSRKGFLIIGSVWAAFALVVLLVWLANKNGKSSVSSGKEGANGGKHGEVDHLTKEQRAAWEKVRAASDGKAYFLCKLQGATEQKWMIYADHEGKRGDPQWTQRPNLSMAYGGLESMAEYVATRPDVQTVVFVDMYSKRDPFPVKWGVSNGKSVEITDNPKNERWASSLREFLKGVQVVVVK